MPKLKQFFESDHQFKKDFRPSKKFIKIKLSLPQKSQFYLHIFWSIHSSRPKQLGSIEEVMKAKRKFGWTRWICWGSIWLEGKKIDGAKDHRTTTLWGKWTINQPTIQQTIVERTHGFRAMDQKWELADGWELGAILYSSNQQQRNYFIIIANANKMI